MSAVFCWIHTGRCERTRSREVHLAALAPLPRRRKRGRALPRDGEEEGEESGVGRWKEAELFCGPFLRKVEVAAYVGSIQNLKDLKGRRRHVRRGRGMGGHHLFILIEETFI